MKRCHMHVVLSVDIEGEDDTEIAERFADAIEFACETEGVNDITVQSTTTHEAPYTVPHGAERWAEAAKKIRFADDRRFAPSYDGTWWWADGHAALRCEGLPPEGVTVPKTSPFDTKGPRLTEWGEVETAGNAPHLTARRATVDPTISVQTKFLDLVTSVYPDVKWFVGETLDQPIRAVHGDTCVAIVMGFKPNDLKRAS